MAGGGERKRQRRSEEEDMTEMASEDERRLRMKKKKKKKREGPLQRRKKLLPGEKVEVLISDEGLKGSWHEAVVIGCKQEARLVEYSYLYADNSKSKLRETISVTAAIEGLSTIILSNHRGNLRPLMPPSPEIQASEVKYGMCVDAWMDDAWWEGVVFDYKDGEMERLVFFPDNGDQHMFMIHQLRRTQKWNEASGRWRTRREWMLIQVLEKFVDGEGLPVSTREIWYDLRSMVAFQKNIGMWIFGFHRDWHPLVSALIEELASVVKGGVVLNAAHSNQYAISGALVPRNEISCLGDMNTHENTTENPPSICNNHPEEKTAEASHSPEVWRRGEVLANLDKYPKVLSDFIAYFYSRISTHSSLGGKPVYALRDKARAFLFSCGWEFKPTCYNHYYFAPDGTKFCTLGKACVAWLSFKKSGEKNVTSCEETGTCFPYDEPPVVANNIIEKREKRSSLYKGPKKQVSWQPVDAKPEYCPQAIELCSRGSKYTKARHEGSESADYCADNLFLQVRKHLLYMGWKVERRKTKYLREMLTSPEGVCFYSLQKACLYLMNSKEKKSHGNTCKNNLTGDALCIHSEVVSPIQSDLLHYSLTEKGKNGRVCLTKGGAPMKRTDKGRKRLFPRKISDSVFDDGIREAVSEGPRNKLMLLDDYNLENPVNEDANAIYFRETLLKYKDYHESLKADDKKRASKQDVIAMRLNAHNCLMSIGWTHCSPSSIRQWVYDSPDGKHCRSLYSACRLCLEEYQGGTTVRFLKERNTKKLRDARSEDPAIKNTRSGPFTSRLPQKNNIKECRNKFASSKSYQLKIGLSCHTGHKISKKKCSFLASKYLRARMRGNKIGYYCQISGKKMGSQLVNGHRYNLCGKSLARATGSSARLFAGCSTWKNTKSTLSALIDNDIIMNRQKVQYIEKRNGQVLMEGRLTRDGIKCDCCKMIFSLTRFELHAGNNSCRPAEHLFLLDGRSLRQCQMEMMSGSVKRFLRGRTKGDYSSYQSDATCSICRFGGKLVLCDYCPSSFHTTCLGLEGVPEGKWCCASCRCHICGMADFDSNNEKFTENTIIFCDQCELQYHVGCLRNKGITGLENCPTGNWFCSNVCSEIFFELCKLVGNSKSTSLDGLSWSILRSRNEKKVPSINPVDGQAVAEQNSKRHLALKILQECFLSIPESRTSSDIVADIIFNNESELNRLNFRGFYTMVLERGDEMISVATFRVLGNKAAELPLVGTRDKHRRQGMCRLLMDELEKFLFGFGVERLILPAVPQLLETWTTSFGFSEMSNSDIIELGKYTFINFQGSTLCQKFLSTKKITSKSSGENCYNLSVVGDAMSSDSNSSLHESEVERHKGSPFVGVEATEFGQSMIDTPLTVKLGI